MSLTAAQIAALTASRYVSGIGDMNWPREWWNDDIEGGDRWTVDVGVGDCLHEPSATALRSGAAGLLVKTRTTGAANGDIVQIHQNLLLPAQDYFTFSVWVRLPTVAPTYVLAIHPGLYSGGHKYRGALYWNNTDDKWYYTNSAGAGVALAGAAYAFPANTWIRLQLQIRASNLHYGTVTLPDRTQDLSAQDLYDEGVVAGSGAIVELKIIASATPPATAHFDDLTLTHSPTA